MTKPAAPTNSELPEMPTPVEEWLKRTWERYGNVIYAIIGLVALGLVVREGMDYLSARKELATERAYTACTAPDMLKAFAESHKGHPLAGVADLRVGDAAYSAGKYSDALGAYQDAATALPEGPLRSRARLGLAISEMRSGRKADGKAALRKLVDDQSEAKPLRCEAAYHLANIEVAEGDTSDVQHLTEDVMRIDPSNRFGERLIALGATLPEKPSSLLPAPAKP